MFHCNKICHRSFKQNAKFQQFERIYACVIWFKRVKPKL